MLKASVICCPSVVGVQAAGWPPSVPVGQPNSVSQIFLPPSPFRRRRWRRRLAPGRRARQRRQPLLTCQ
jgi:hypothetical protein